MHISSTLICALSVLTATAQAEEQYPFRAWWDKARSYIPSSTQGPIGYAAASVAAQKTVHLNVTNWKTVLSPDLSAKVAEPQQWWVFVSGGNKTCYGQCEKVEKAWNTSTALLSASRSAPKLAMINCDQTPVLCNAWAASPPAIWLITVPPTPDTKTTIRIHSLNTTTTTAQDIVALHTKHTWETAPIYEGHFHPFDGTLARFDLNVPAGYVLWAFSIVPRWLTMVVVSFATRTFMGRRIQPQAGAPAPAAAGARPAAAS